MANYLGGGLLLKKDKLAVIITVILERRKSPG